MMLNIKYSSQPHTSNAKGNMKLILYLLFTSHGAIAFLTWYSLALASKTQAILCPIKIHHLHHGPDQLLNGDSLFCSCIGKKDEQCLDIFFTDWPLSEEPSQIDFWTETFGSVWAWKFSGRYSWLCWRRRRWRFEEPKVNKCFCIQIYLRPFFDPSVVYSTSYCPPQGNLYTGGRLTTVVQLAINFKLSCWKRRK